MKKFIKLFASIVLVLSLTGVSSQVVCATTATASLSSAEDVPSNPTIKRGQKVIVTIKDTKKQIVSVYNQNGRKTGKSIKMGSKFTVKAVKRIKGKKLIKVSSTKWLNANDVTQY